MSEDVRFEATAEEHSPICPVCGEEVGAAPEICPACDTPHHWDCWEYNGGCATYGCPIKTRKPKKRPVMAAPSDGASAVPDKIPFPRLEAGAFLGFFFVTAPTAIFAIACELAAITFMGQGATGLMVAAVAGMFCALLWAATTAECYNLDLVKGRISRSKLFLGKEIFEWGIAPLRNLRSLDVVPCSYQNKVMRCLVAHLHSGGRLELAPPFLPASKDEQTVRELLVKIEGGTTIQMGPGARLPGTGRGASALPSGDGVTPLLED